MKFMSMETMKLRMCRINDFDEDLLYNKLNENSSLKDCSCLKENKILDNKLFEISYDIYKEKYNKYRKRNFMILLNQIIH